MSATHYRLEKWHFKIETSQRKSPTGFGLPLTILPSELLHNFWFLGALWLFHIRGSKCSSAEQLEPLNWLLKGAMCDAILPLDHRSFRLFPEDTSTKPAPRKPVLMLQTRLLRTISSDEVSVWCCSHRSPTLYICWIICRPGNYSCGYLFSRLCYCWWFWLSDTDSVWTGQGAQLRR